VGLSHEILEVAGAEAVATAEGNMCGAKTKHANSSNMSLLMTWTHFIYVVFLALPASYQSHIGSILKKGRCGKVSSTCVGSKVRKGSRVVL